MMTRTQKIAAQRGLSLVELLVALTIGSLLIVGAVFVYSQSRTTARVSDTIARLQENGRFVMALMEPDVQLAGQYGYFNDPSLLKYRDSTGTLTPITAMRVGEPKFDNAPAAAHACGDNFALDLLSTAAGVEGDYLPADEITDECKPFGAGVVEGADTLIIRRASATPQAHKANVLQLHTHRSVPWEQVVYASATAPSPLEANMRDIRDIVVNVYYVSKDSDFAAGFPSLRRKSLLLNESGVYGMEDQEIMSGVEDLQIQFGLDMGADTDNDGIPDDVDDNEIADVVNGQAVRYVNADDTTALKFGQVASVRVWVRLRAEQGEVGYTNTERYDYGSRTGDDAFVANDNIRRLLVSRTFFLRNARMLKD